MAMMVHGEEEYRQGGQIQYNLEGRLGGKKQQQREYKSYTERVGKNMKGRQKTARKGTERMGRRHTAGKKVERWVHCMLRCGWEDCMW